MLDEVGRHFSDNNCRLFRSGFVKAQPLGQIYRLTARLAHLAGFTDRKEQLVSHTSTTSYFHRVIITRVPWPGEESIENSFDSRLAPVNPRPSPLPVV